MESQDQTQKETTPEFVFGVGLTFKVDIRSVDLKKLWTETLGDFELVEKDDNLYFTRLDVSAADEAQAKERAWANIAKHFDVEPFDEEIVFVDKHPIPPGIKSAVTTEPLIRWAIELHCKVAFKVEVFLAAWQARLPTLRPVVDYEASDEKTTIFDVEMFVQASSNAKATSMASGLLKRHFDSLVILEMLAEPSKD